ncbi:rhomboid family intramembrane serine protease [Roseibaca calidilacus]|uniref:rhomboid family intramembrane serine protease n=1 Tax=Roseibaca calidilacus TaxID=1666912 RepID=UPI0009311A5A|nr:rhomboid family intramembrane serine protease [Roseibaca calidilacus]
MIPMRDHNPSGKRPYVTYALLAANILIFISYYGLFANDTALMRFFMTWGMVPAALGAGFSFETLLTHQFLHGGILHLAFNMLFLWVYGDNMEEEWGHLRFLGFYLACGVAAGLAQYLSEPQSYIPMVGASGAIAGVLGGYLLFYPRARVDMLLFLLVYFRIIPIPAWLVLGGWFGMQVFAGLGPSDDGVAYWAHIGGFVAGVVFALPLWLRRGGRALWTRTHGHPPHPEAQYRFVRTDIPAAGRRRNPWLR